MLISILKTLFKELKCQVFIDIVKTLGLTVFGFGDLQNRNATAIVAESAHFLIIVCNCDKCNVIATAI